MSDVRSPPRVRGLGQGKPRPLGPGYCYGGPWLGATMLRVVKGPA